MDSQTVRAKHKEFLFPCVANYYAEPVVITETAIMLAKIYTGQQEIIALRHSYAGRSQGAIAITGQQPWRVLPTQIAGVKHALSPYCYRCPLGLEYPDCGIRCAQDIEDLIRTTTT